MKHFLQLLKTGLEGQTDGKPAVEKEIVTYGKIVDIKDLEKAARKEEQEQWEIRSREKDNAYSGCIRLRCVDGKRYILTIKSFKPDRGDLTETEVELAPEVGVGFLEEFKKLATSGMLKTRYFFPVPDSELVYEVDVYYDERNQPRQWCKIDLEVTDMRTKRPDLPIRLDEAREIPPKNRSDEDQKFLDRLMEREFVAPNPYSK